MKAMTTSEAETKRQRPVEFLRRIGKDDAADQFAAMDAQQYADHKGATLANPFGRYTTMPRTKSKVELQAELDAVLGDPAQTADDLRRQVYTEHVINYKM